MSVLVDVGLVLLLFDGLLVPGVRVVVGRVIVHVRVGSRKRLHLLMERVVREVVVRVAVGDSRVAVGLAHQVGTPNKIFLRLTRGTRRATGDRFNPSPHEVG